MKMNNRFVRPGVRFCLPLAVALALGCGGKKPPQSSVPTFDPNAPIAPAIVFNDAAESNTEAESGTFDLTFVEHDGEEVVLADFRGKQNVLLVVTRGYSGYLCPYCSAQTARLIRNQDEFERRNTKVVVVYPGEKEAAQSFAEHVIEVAAETSDDMPLSLVLDEDLAAVDRLMIRGELAKPSTYILDLEGNVRFAYVGRTMSDRPSLKAILDKLDEVNGSEP